MLEDDNKLIFLISFTNISFVIWIARDSLQDIYRYVVGKYWIREDFSGKGSKGNTSLRLGNNLNTPGKYK